MTQQLPSWVRDWWRPIETAPRDDLLLVYIPFQNGCGCFDIVSWDHEDEDWREREGDLLGAHKPSHWMPLPPAPQPAARDEQEQSR